MTHPCAVYARYSSDRQSPESIPDQIRKCRQYAKCQGFEILPDHVYTDGALSGVGSDRPGLKKLIEATLRAPVPFEIVLVDDTSRLSRNMADAVQLFERLNFAGIRIISVSQGIDTRNEQAEVLVAFHGMVDALYVKELAKKTHRGLEGRALRGFHTGGRCFGYVNEQTPEGVRLRINEPEAAIVRRIFAMCADGFSLKAIAKTLNAESIPAPRARAGRPRSNWCPTAIRAMLRRDLYRGQIVWNRTKFVKAPGTNKRLSRPRPQSEWCVMECPELRIISEQLWTSVQNRIAFVHERYGGTHVGLFNRAASSPHLLSGFLKCGVCGANLVIVTGRGPSGHLRYGCPQQFYRGACSNRLKVRQDWLEDRLLSQLQTEVLRPEVVEYAIREFGRQLNGALRGLSDDLGRMKERREQLEAELARLTSAIAETGPSKALTAAIAARERELDTITDRLLSSRAESVQARLEDIRRFVATRLGNIRELLHTDVPRARAELAKHVTAVRLTPDTTGAKPHYIAEGEWDLLGGYAEENPEGEKRVRNIAGGGFEPPTFGL